MIKTVAQTAKTTKPVNLSNLNAEMSQFLWENFTKVLLLYMVTFGGIFSIHPVQEHTCFCTQNGIVL